MLNSLPSSHLGRGITALRRSRSIGLALLVGALAATLAVVTGPSAQAATLFQDDFEDGDANGWTVNSGTWSVVPDDTYVYQQSSSAALAISIADTPTVGSGPFTVAAADVKLGPSNSWAGGAELLSQVADAKNHYYLALRAGTLELGLRTGGTATVLASAPYVATAGRWYQLSINTFFSDRVIGSVKGPQGTLSISGASSATRLGSKVGLATRAATASFDNVTVSDDRISPTSSATITVAPPLARCSVDFTILAAWANGYQEQVTVTNTGQVPLIGWRVNWTFAGEQVIAYLWGGDWWQHGPDVEVTNASWNGALAPGAATNFGFMVTNTDETGLSDATCTPLR